MKIGDTVFAILAILVGSKCFMDDVLAHFAILCTAYAADEDTFNNNKTHILIRRSSTEENMLKKAEFDLFWLFTYLRSFIGNEGFDVDTFAREREALRVKILSIGLSYEYIQPDNLVLKHQLEIAEDMYSCMEVSTKYLLYFRESHETGSIWVCKIIDLNVRLLKFLDTFGNLDVRNSGYISDLMLYWNNTITWQATFKRLEKVPAKNRILFFDEITKARQTLRVLGSQAPRFDEYLF
ncbi:hypothetical protein OXX79_009951 [Metschnikowia pulcherrima]